MENNDLIPVTLWIAGRGYRIRIQKQNEEAIRLSVKIANDRINELRHAYEGKDDQDFVAMCLLMYATDQVSDPSALNKTHQGMIEQLNENIEKVIKSSL